MINRAHLFAIFPSNGRDGHFFTKTLAGSFCWVLILQESRLPSALNRITANWVEASHFLSRFTIQLANDRLWPKTAPRKALKPAN
jgi:hypothetical protein